MLEPKINTNLSQTLFSFKPFNSLLPWLAKGIVHLFVYSPSSCSKPIWLSFCSGTKLHAFPLGAFPLHGTARYGSVRLTFGEFSTGYRTGYLVLFSVPPRPRFQANRTITKTWCVNSADPWLAGENHHCLRHWTCGTRHNRPARFKSAQPAKDAHVLNERTSLLTPKMFYVVCWGSTDCRLIDSRERIQWELDGELDLIHVVWGSF